MNKFKISNSTIHGRGLVATQRINKTDFIGFIKGEIMFKVNKSEHDTFTHPDWVGFKKNYWIDPVPPFKYINHSCEPNCGIKGTKKVCALREIQNGEELTIDYSTTEIDEHWFLDCTCRKKLCRRKVCSIQSLPKNIFDSYKPFIPTEFKNIYLNLKSKKA